MKVLFDPEPDAALDAVWARSEKVAQRIEEAVDRIEDDDPRSRRRAFSGGLFAISVTTADEGWTILWDHDEQAAMVRFIGETASI